MLSSNSCKRWFKRPSISERTRKSPDRVGIRACLGDVETSKNDNRNRCAYLAQEDGGLPTTLAAGTAGRKRRLGLQPAVSRWLTFQRDTTTASHLVWIAGAHRLPHRWSDSLAQGASRVAGDLSCWDRLRRRCRSKRRRACRRNRSGPVGTRSRRGFGARSAVE
jgi:hypothetical protein